MARNHTRKSTVLFIGVSRHQCSGQKTDKLLHLCVKPFLRGLEATSGRRLKGPLPITSQLQATYVRVYMKTFAQNNRFRHTDRSNATRSYLKDLRKLFRHKTPSAVCCFAHASTGQRLSTTAGFADKTITPPLTLEKERLTCKLFRVKMTVC